MQAASRRTEVAGSATGVVSDSNGNHIPVSMHTHAYTWMLNAYMYVCVHTYGYAAATR